MSSIVYYIFEKNAYIEVDRPRYFEYCRDWNIEKWAVCYGWRVSTAEIERRRIWRVKNPDRDMADFE